MSRSQTIIRSTDERRRIEPVGDLLADIAMPPGPEIAPARIDALTLATARNQTAGIRDRGGLTRAERRAVEQLKRRAPGNRRADVAPPKPLSSVRGDPEATIRKMADIQRAATANSAPSAQDRADAARATQERLQAETDLAARRARPGFADVVVAFARINRMISGGPGHGELLSRSA